MKIWSGAGGLGDILLLTVPCKYINDITVVLPKTIDRFSFLFDGIANVHLVDSQPTPPTQCQPGGGPYVERLMRYCGVEGECPIPKINIPQEKIKEATDILSEYSNPIVFKPTCSPSGASDRQPKDDTYWNFLRDSDHDVLLFGSDENHNFDFVKKTFVNLDLQLLAVMYSLIGEYVGVDTGDCHLMIACGGITETHISSQFSNYIYADCHYDSDRVTFINFNE